MCWEGEEEDKGSEEKKMPKKEEKTFLFPNRTISKRIICALPWTLRLRPRKVCISLKPSIVSLIIQVLPIILLARFNLSLEIGCINFPLNTFIQIKTSHYSSK